MELKKKKKKKKLKKKKKKKTYVNTVFLQQKIFMSIEKNSYT